MDGSGVDDLVFIKEIELIHDSNNNNDNKNDGKNYSVKSLEPLDDNDTTPMKIKHDSDVF